MLVLSRKVGERLMIGDEVELAILDIKGLHVRFGITAPDDVKIFREELYDKIKADHKEQKD